MDNKLEEMDFDIIGGLPVCKLRAKIIKGIPLGESEKLIEQERCYSWCNSTCSRHPDYGKYI